MPNPNFIRDYPVPLDLSPGDQMPVQPAGPRTNDYVAPTLAEHWIAGMVGTFDGVNRNTGGGGGVTIAATPPTPAVPGMLWWDSVGGQLYVYYNDGNSQQWVVANNSTMQAIVGNPTMVNVLDHGAKGDGTTDDTAAIQAVLNTYAGKATAFVPNTGSPYLVTGLSLPSNTDLLLNGTILMKSGTNVGGAGVVNMTGNSNIIIRGYGIIDGNDASFTGNVISAGLAPANVTNLRVSGITLQNAHYWNLNVTGASNVVVSGVTILGGHAAPEFAAESTNCWLMNCLIDGTGNGDYGFAFYGGVTNSGAIGNVVRNSSVGTSSAGPGIGILSDSAQPAPCSNILVANNIVHGNGGGGLSCVNPTGGFQSGIVFSNNRSYGNNLAAGESATADLFVDNTTGITIIGNQMSANGNGAIADAAGIFLGPNASHAGIFSNQIFNVGQGTTTGAGIWIGGSNHVHVSGNHIYDDQGTPTTQYSLIGGVGAHCSIVGNFLDVPPNIGLASDTIMANAINGLWQVGFDTTGSAVNSVISGANGHPTSLQYQSFGLPVWRVGTDGVSQTGGNAGANYNITPYNDSSALQSVALSVNRASSLTTVTKLLLSGSPVVASTDWAVEGAIVGWNFTESGGETDFFSSKGLGGGGFNFYNVATGFSGSPTLIANMDAIGGLTVPYVNVNPGGPRIDSGTGVPSTTRVAGSLWLRTDGGVGSTLYVSRGGGTWNAVAGV